jgi:cytochrome b involved in lipid metabolism
VKKHNKDYDCWVIVEGKVYDVSTYMDDHPGGKDMLLENTNGKDATEAYEEADHTKRAKQLMKNYYVADLVQ